MKTALQRITTIASVALTTTAFLSWGQTTMAQSLPQQSNQLAPAVVPPAADFAQSGGATLDQLLQNPQFAEVAASPYAAQYFQRLNAVNAQTAPTAPAATAPAATAPAATAPAPTAPATTSNSSASNSTQTPATPTGQTQLGSTTSPNTGETSPVSPSLTPNPDGVLSNPTPENNIPVPVISVSNLQQLTD